MNIAATLLLAATLSATTASSAPTPAPALGLSPCLAPLGAIDTLQAATRAALNNKRQQILSRVAAPQQPPPTDAALAARYGELGQLYHAHLIFDPAVACYRAVLALTPDDYRAHYLLAYLQQQRSDQAAAARNYQHSLRLDPTLTPAALRLAMIRIDQQRNAEALALLEDAEKHPAYRAWALFEHGQLLLNQGDHRHAARLLQQALAAAPDANRIHYPLAMAARGLGERERARRHLALSGDRLPPFPDPLVDALEQLKGLHHPHYTDAMRAVRQRRYTAAVTAFRAGLDSDPDNLDARISLARALYLSGDHQAAGAQLQRITARAPLPLALFLLAIWQQQQQRPDAAIRLYQEALRGDPEHSGAHFYLADQLLLRGDYSAAATHYRRAWQLTPGNSNARLREIIALAHTGTSPAKLLSALVSALHDHPDDPGISYYRIRLLTLADDPTLRDISRADGLAHALYAEYPAPDQAELLALTAAAEGRFDDALRWLQQSLDAAREHTPELLPALQKLQRRYQQGLPPAEPAFETPPQLPPLDAQKIFRDYPNQHAF